jgi:NADH-quinone oxidoreductase subunit J
MITFVILAAIMLIGAVGVITLRQPVHAALSLVGTLLTLAVAYVTLQAHFLAAVQVIVYAGAIMVLFLFVIMLLNVEGDRPAPTLRWMPPLAYLSALGAAVAIAVVAFRDSMPLPDLAVVQEVLRGGGAGQIAESLFTEFMLSFQLVGVLLLTGIVGAVSLVQRRATEDSHEYQSPVPGSIEEEPRGA